MVNLKHVMHMHPTQWTTLDNIEACLFYSEGCSLIILVHDVYASWFLIVHQCTSESFPLSVVFQLYKLVLYASIQLLGNCVGLLV